MATYRARRLLAYITTLALLPGLAVLVGTPPATADPVPAPYSGSTHSDLEDITVLLGGANETRVISGHETTSVDSTGTVKTSATASNLDPAVLGTQIPTEAYVEYHSEQPAGPASDAGTFLALTELEPVVSLGAGTGETSAAWAGETVCVAAGTPLARSFTKVDSTTVADNVVPTLTVAEIGALTTTGTVQLVANGATNDVRATAEGTVGSIDLLTVAGVPTATVTVTNPTRLVVTHDGDNARTVVYTAPEVTLNVAGLAPIIISSGGNGGSGGSGPITIPGVAGAEIIVSVLDTPVTTATGADVPAVLSIDVKVTALLGGAELANVHIGLLPLTADATAPTGGVECPVDTDGDGLSDADELIAGTDPTNPDTDGDGLTDGQEVDSDGAGPDIGTRTDPLRGDTDGDGLGDDAELDTDGAGPDTGTGTDPLDADTDDGGVPDGAEVWAGTDPLAGSDDAPVSGDSDGDGLTDAEEATLGTNPAMADTDGDGLTDGEEVDSDGAGPDTGTGTDPLDPDTDDGGVYDGPEAWSGTEPVATPGDDAPVAGDSDGDGLADATEPGTTPATDPNNTDTDGDGLNDGAEALYGTDPTNPDTDGDGLSDGAEVITYGTDPLDPDTDDDGLTDGGEVDTDGAGPDAGTGTDPLDADTDDGGVNDGQEVLNGTEPISTPSDDFAPVDTTAPVAPVITSPTEGSSTGDTTPTVTGTGEPGATIKVTEGGTTICTATVAADGTWSCTPTTALRVGQHTFTATATDAAGNTSPADTVTFTITAPVSQDTDGDGLSNTDEAKAGTNPDDPDTDNDGLQDGQELNSTGTDPMDPDTDNDGLKDGPEVNGMTVRERFELCGKPARKKIRVTTNPLAKDTDKDGLTDGREVKGYRIKQVVLVSRSGDTITIGKTRSNPTKADTDKDGVKDKAEKTGSANTKWKRRKTDPSKCDTDGGGVSDGREIKLGSDPTRIKSGPNDFESRMWHPRSGAVSGG